MAPYSAGFIVAARALSAENVVFRRAPEDVAACSSLVRNVSAEPLWTVHAAASDTQGLMISARHVIG